MRAEYRQGKGRAGREEERAVGTIRAFSLVPSPHVVMRPRWLPACVDVLLCSPFLSTPLHSSSLFVSSLSPILSCLSLRISSIHDAQLFVIAACVTLESVKVVPRTTRRQRNGGSSTNQAEQKKRRGRNGEAKGQEQNRLRGGRGDGARSSNVEPHQAEEVAMKELARAPGVGWW